MLSQSTTSLASTTTEDNAAAEADASTDSEETFVGLPSLNKDSPSPNQLLTQEQRKLALAHRASKDKTSWHVPFYFLAASLGKLILGFGASQAVSGHYQKKRPTLIVGAVLASLGLIGCVAAAIGFGSCVSRINKKRGLALKCVSISGALLIGLGYAINSYLVATSTLSHIRLSFLPLLAGTALMSISLPNFTAYTELARGRIPFIPKDKRAVVALACSSPAIGSLFAGWVTGEHSEWPPAFNAAVLTFSIALLLVGVSLNWSNALKARASEYDTLLASEEAFNPHASAEKLTV